MLRFVRPHQGTALTRNDSSDEAVTTQLPILAKKGKQNWFILCTRLKPLSQTAIRQPRSFRRVIGDVNP